MIGNSKNEIHLDDQELSNLFHEIDQQYGFNFTHYSRASISRRVIRFMHLNYMFTLSKLKDALLNDQSLFEFFIEEVVVNVTEMFRDPFFYKSLRENVFPFLSTYPHIRIWDAGCATGEELLSLAIMLEESNLLNRTRIYATDISQKSLNRARSGMVSMSEMPRYEKNYILAGGHRKLNNYYYVNTINKRNANFDLNLLKNVVFYPHNLASDASFNEFHLIICRNVLIYFDKVLQEHVLKLFFESLVPLGFLGLGKKETIYFSESKNSFKILDKQEKIYRKMVV